MRENARPGLRLELIFQKEAVVQWTGRCRDICLEVKTAKLKNRSKIFLLRSGCLCDLDDSGTGQNHSFGMQKSYDELFFLVP